jgi:hypothetical protein
MLALLAQDVPDESPIGALFTINQTTVMIILSVVIPLVLGVLLKPTNPEWVKVLAGGVVAGIATLITEAIRDDGTAVLSQEMLVQFAVQWIGVIATYLGVWKPLQINRKMGPGIVPIEKKAA